MPIRASERFALFFNYTILSDRPDKDHDRSSSRLALHTHRPTGYRASRHSRPIFIYLFTLSSSTVRATRPFRPCPLPVTRDVTLRVAKCIPQSHTQEAPAAWPGRASVRAWCDLMRWLQGHAWLGHWCVRHHWPGGDRARHGRRASRPVRAFPSSAEATRAGRY